MNTSCMLQWLDRPPMVEEIQENEEEDDASDTQVSAIGIWKVLQTKNSKNSMTHNLTFAFFAQVWDDFEETSERFRKSLYYGRYPSSDRLSLPVTSKKKKRKKSIFNQ